MSGKALDEERHKDDKSHTHQQHSIPVRRDPLSNGQESFLIEEQIFQPDQRTLSVHLSALEEDITVTLEVITGGSWPQGHPLRQSWNLTCLGPV